MRKLPILFSGPMVRAILREIDKPGTGKTQTRRVLASDKPNSLFNGQWTDSYVLDPGNQSWRERELRYAVGDRLYVREAWRCHYTLDDTAPRDLPPENSLVSHVADGDRAIHFRSSGRRRPGMHMPRWASRVTLIVTNVRVQRLQDISREDAVSEGLFHLKATDHYAAVKGAQYFGAAYPDAREAFRYLWNSINVERGYGRETNPWVAAYTFRPILGNIDQVPADA